MYLSTIGNITIFNLTAPVTYPDPNKVEYFELPTLESNDRLVKLLRETDVAGVALPAFDRDLYYRTKRPNDYIIFQRPYTLFAEGISMIAIKLSLHNEVKSDDVRMAVTSRHKSFVRHQYFEGAIDFRRRLPYRYASAFEKQLPLKIQRNWPKLCKTLRVQFLPVRAVLMKC